MVAEYIDTRDIPLADLSKFPGNARRGDTPKIRESVKANGQYRALVVRDTGDGLVILAGNHTRDALAEEGHQAARCEVIRCDDQTAARINLVDNRTGEIGGYDDEALALLLAPFEVDPVGTGWTDAEIAALLHPPDDLGDLPGRPDGDGPPPPPPADPVTKPGDVWLLGPHRIICGDCRDFDTVSTLLADTQINVAFTSPPYASQRKYDESSGFLPIPPDEYVDWFEDVQANVRAVLAEDGSWFVNIKAHCDDGQRHLYVHDLTIAHVRRWGWRFVDDLCWVDTRNGFPGTWPNRFKDAWEPVFHFSTNARIKFDALANGSPTDDLIVFDPDTRIAANDGQGGGYYVSKQAREVTSGLARPSNVIYVPAGGEGSHSAAFPVALPAWFIRAYSDPGDAVFDPFMGSGTTLIAAHKENRTAYGCEISPAYCDVICRRYQEASGELPALVQPDGSSTPHDFLADAFAVDLDDDGSGLGGFGPRDPAPLAVGGT